MSRHVDMSDLAVINNSALMNGTTIVKRPALRMALMAEFLDRMKADPDFFRDRSSERARQKIHARRNAKAPSSTNAVVNGGETLSLFHIFLGGSAG